MREWPARLGKIVDDLATANVAPEPTRRLVCGFGRVDRDNWCPEIIGWVVGGGFDGPLVALPIGLSDRSGTPGDFRWSTTAIEKMRSGRRPRAGNGAHLESASGIRYNLFAGQDRPLPWRVPCRRNHVNIVDRDHVTEIASERSRPKPT